MRASEVRVGVVTLTWRSHARAHRLLDCVASIPDLDVAIVVVVNESRDLAAVRALAEHPSRPSVIAVQDNLGFGGGTNLGLKYIREVGVTHVLVVNDDIVFDGGIVSRLVRRLDDSTAFIAPLSFSLAGALESAGLRLDPCSMRGVEHLELTELPHDGVVDAAQGSFLLTRQDVLDRLGLLDAGFFYTWEDVDWCVRARRWLGLATVIDGDVACTHIGSQSMGGATTYNPIAEYQLIRNMLRFYARWEACTDAVDRLLRHWMANHHRDSHRVRGQSAGDANVSARVVGRAIDDFTRGRAGRWHEEIERLPGAWLPLPEPGVGYLPPGSSLVIASGTR